jgi:GPI-GlcNAc transferase complex PIG-U subunit
MINPFSIGTCIAKSSLVFHNLLLTMTFYFFMTCKNIIYYREIASTSFYLDQLVPFIIALCLASSISLYPIILIAPALLQFSKNSAVSLSISEK